MNRRDFLKGSLLAVGVVLLGDIAGPKRLLASSLPSGTDSLERWLLDTGRASIEPEVYQSVAQAM